MSLILFAFLFVIKGYMLFAIRSTILFANLFAILIRMLFLKIGPLMSQETDPDLMMCPF